MNHLVRVLAPVPATTLEPGPRTFYPEVLGGCIATTSA
jgi:hypothetical protein